MADTVLTGGESATYASGARTALERLTITAGRDVPLEFTVQDSAGAALDLAGVTVTWAARTAAGAEVALGPYTADPGQDPSLGVATVTLAAADTTALGTYALLWEALATDGAGHAVSLASGVLVLLDPITDVPA